MVEYARELGMKVAIIAYDDNDPSNNQGPVNAEVFTRCWQQVGSPRDLCAFARADSNRQSVNWLEIEFNELRGQKRKPPQPATQGLGSEDSNKAAGL